MTATTWRFLVLSLFCCIGIGESARATTPPGNFPNGSAVEIASTGNAGQPSIAVDAREGFVVTWQEHDGNESVLRYAVISPAGVELRRGEIARGMNWFVNWADFPALVVLDNGDWVSYWLERTAGGPESYDIRMVRSRDQGRSWSAAMTPHRDGTATEHGFVSLMPAGGDRVLAIWLDGRRSAQADHDAHDAKSKPAQHEAHGEEEGTMTLRSALIDRAGRMSEERELDDSTCSCCQTDAARVAGRTVVVYRDRSAQEIRDISMLARSADGVWSPSRNLHHDNWRIAGCPVNGPAIASDGRNMLVVWTTGAGGEIAAKYTLRSWDKPAPALPLASGARMRGRLDAAVWDKGYVISWIGSGGKEGAPGSFSGLMLTQVGANGEVLAQQNVANLPLGRVSGNPRLASNGRQLLLVWAEPGAQGQGTRLAARMWQAR